jgi:hypothetical protein
VKPISKKKKTRHSKMWLSCTLLVFIYINTISMKGSVSSIVKIHIFVDSVIPSVFNSQI